MILSESEDNRSHFAESHFLRISGTLRVKLQTLALVTVIRSQFMHSEISLNHVPQSIEEEKIARERNNFNLMESKGHRVLDSEHTVCRGSDVLAGSLGR